MILEGFVGGSNVVRSRLEDCEETINWIVESPSPGTPKLPKWLARRPGLRLAYTVGSSPIQALFSINGRAFGVSGTTFFEQFEDESITVRGSVASAISVGDSATICSNGSAGDQVFIVVGGLGYIFTLSTNAFAAITDPDFPIGTAAMGEFFAGYFLVLVENSRTVQWSALEDGTSWDALDVMERSWASDNISFIKRNGTHIWIVGNQTSEVWYLTGGEEIFAPAQESLIEHGCVAPFSGVRIADQSIAWLDQDERGSGQVVVAQSLQPQKISTYAIDLFEQVESGVLEDAFAWAAQIEGHQYYVLNNDSGTFRLTPVFDAPESLWYHWAHWDSTAVQWVPFVPRCHMYAFQKHYVGDRRTGAVYELSMDNLNDETVAV